MLFAKFNKSCLITYFGVLFGVLSVYFVFSSNLKLSLIFLVTSGVCDMFDGKFARLFERTQEEKEFGVQLDSLCDTFCFLAVPVMIMISLKMFEIWNIVAYFIFILCGVSRLGYFNIKSADSEKAIKVYQGLPVTSTAISFPLVGLLFNAVSLSLFQWLYFGLTVLTSLLMIVNIKIPKFKGIAFIIVPVLAIILIAILLLLVK